MNVSPAFATLPSAHAVVTTTRRHWLQYSLGLATTAVLSGCATPLLPSHHRGKPWAMPGVSTRTFRAAPLPGDSSPRHYQVMLYTPSGPAPEGGFPVVYALDGNLTFALLAQLIHNRSSRGAALRGPSAIVVGLGHSHLPDGEVHDRAARTYDYTPPYAGVGPDSQGRAQGGAVQFLDFIAQQIQPMVASTQPANMAQQTLFGHSFGGLLCLHTLFSRPQMFQQYVAVSPSLWWGDGMIWQAAQQFLAQPSNASTLRLHLSHGSEEAKPRESNRPSNPDREAALAKARALGNLADLHARMAHSGKVHSSYTVWPNADHGTSMHFGCMQAARAAVEWKV